MRREDLESLLVEHGIMASDAKLSDEDSFIINKCYVFMSCLFKNEDSLVDYIKLNGFSGMRALYEELEAHQSKIKELKDEILDNEDTIAKLESSIKRMKQSCKDVNQGTSVDEKLKDSSASIHMCISTLKDLNTSFNSGLLSRMISELSSVQGTLNSLVGE